MNGLIQSYSERLFRLVKNNRVHQSFVAYRLAGALETLLFLQGFFKSGQKFEYLTGGKKYFPLILDFRWIESYPHYILRKSREYLSQINYSNN